MTQETGVSLEDMRTFFGEEDGSAVREWIDRARRTSLAARLWKKETALWTKDAAGQAEIAQRLGWLEAPDRASKTVPELTAFAAEVKADGYTNTVLIGMGGSSLAAEVYRNVCGLKAGHPELTVLDSTDPGRVRDVEARLDLTKTLFLVSSKSGGTIELVSLYKYFADRVRSVSGESWAKQFVVITDPGSPLEASARKDGVRRVFHGYPDVGGRFSALTLFGLVPAALIGVDVAKVLASAKTMAARCAGSVDASENPAVVLGTAMAVLAESGRDKLTFALPRRLASFGDWAEQLVAESSGKEDVGIVPVVGEGSDKPGVYGADRFFAVMESSQEPAEAFTAALERAGQPYVSLRVDSPEDIGGQFFLWEAATAIACSLLKVNAFDQPDVQSAKDRTKTILSKLSAGAQVELRRSEHTLEAFWDNLEEGDYAAILAFLPDRPELRSELEGLADAIRRKTRSAVTLGFGPRYLHSTGQLHKGGPGRAIFHIITAEPAEDVAVPGESYTFGQLETAQAMGDYTALEEKGRWVFHSRLERPDAASLKALCGSVRKALTA
ncbi:MAG: Glucose-6-phosphate isomerase [Candidatus Omnitrophica bacterium]|nr:Glucose-6-phosphate isomerase [Candidatus Omnitrophota bacterium]